MVLRVVYTLHLLDVNFTVIVGSTEKYKSATGVQLSTSEKVTQLLIALKPVLKEGPWCAYLQTNNKDCYEASGRKKM